MIENKYAAQKERGAMSRQKLLAAARALISAKGLTGFTLAEVGQRAGASRALAGFHFTSRGALLRAAYAELLDAPPANDEVGLAPLLAWIADQLRLAAQGDPNAIALLQLTLDPAAQHEAVELRRRYWKQRSGLIQAHLSRAQMRQEIRDDLDPALLAPTILGLLHGEMNRIVALGAPPTPAFSELIEDALARRASRTRNSAAPKGAPQDSQPGLFG